MVREGRFRRVDISKSWTAVVSRVGAITVTRSLLAARLPQIDTSFIPQFRVPLYKSLLCIDIRKSSDLC